MTVQIDGVQQLEDEQRVEAVRRTGLDAGTSEPAFDRLTELAAAMLDTPTCVMSLVLPDRQVFASRFDADAPGVRETPIEHSYCRYVVATGEPLLVEDAREHPLLADNPAIEEYDAIAYLGYPLVDGDGQRLGSVCVLDTKPRHWSEQDVRMLRSFAGLASTEIGMREARRGASEEASATFFATVVHELRSPLASISGFATTLAHRWDEIPDEQRHEFVCIIDAQSQRLARLVDDLLLQSQLDEGHLRARPRDVRVRGVADEVARAFPNLDVRVDVDPELLAHVDPAQLEQMLVNFVSNSEKYGAAPIRITAEQDADDASVSITVFDNGAGIDPSHRTNLFRRFARGEHGTAAPGSGLGLWIVRELARANNGDCCYVAVPGAGAGFRLTFPAA